MSFVPGVVNSVKCQTTTHIIIGGTVYTTPTPTQHTTPGDKNQESQTQNITTGGVLRIHFFFFIIAFTFQRTNSYQARTRYEVLSSAIFWTSRGHRYRCLVPSPPRYVHFFCCA